MARTTAKLAVWYSLRRPPRSAQRRMKKGLGFAAFGMRGRQRERLDSTSRNRPRPRGGVFCRRERDDGLHYENWWGLASPESLPPQLSHPFFHPHQLLPQLQALSLPVARPSWCGREVLLWLTNDDGFKLMCLAKYTVEVANGMMRRRGMVGR